MKSHTALIALFIPLLAHPILAQGPAGETPPIRFGDPADAYDVPFFPGTQYDAAITTPAALLGQRHGSRLAHHDEILAGFRKWDEESDRIRVRPYGLTHEGRELVYAVITSPANHARLADIQTDLGKLEDPRGVDAAAADAIQERSPAVAWIGYSIHGDELSGADASLAVGYHLVAGQGQGIQNLLERVVVVLDPCMNPDGRMRILGMVEQSSGYTPNLDYASMQRGRWPFGRGNHYLFDMNRDWMPGTQPETRGRWRVTQEFHPQLFVDAHEMSALDTFLFYPQARPLNPYTPTDLFQWQRRYAEGTAQAFDARGWSYYTREWADGWAPFYSDAWGALLGATGMLYEQAGIGGSPIRRSTGRILTYREAVHHQAVASLANLETLAANREAALASYRATGARNVAADTPGNDRMLVVVPGANHDRWDTLLRLLNRQNIEYSFAQAAFSARDVVDTLGARSEEFGFPAGSLVVRARQPRRPMVQSFLGFDHRMETSDLKREREEIELKGRSLVYDVTAWSIPLALDLDAHWCKVADFEEEGAVDRASKPTTIAGPEPAVAWLISGADDSSVAFAARAMEDGLQVHVSDEELPVAGHAGLVLPRGSLLVRAIDNDASARGLETRILRHATAAGSPAIYRVGTQLTPDATPSEAPDLGGGHFALLARPRVALLANSPVSSGTYGHLWHHLDRVLGIPHSLLDAQSLGRYDLRRFNVLILPPGRVQGILERNQEKLENWVRAGGTLIACGSSAAALTAGELGLSSVTLRRHALEDLAPYRMDAQRDRAARSIEIDAAQVWGDTQPADENAEDESEEEVDPYEPLEVPEAHDDWLRKFNPSGVMVRAEPRLDAWITYGAVGDLPVFYRGSHVFLSDGSAETAVRLAPADSLRLSGLLWPEARERLADSAWLAVESIGRGQIILFASVPTFRGYLGASARMFANAVVLGPGLGADQPTGW